MSIFPRQGDYALDPKTSEYAPADITLKHIEELINQDFSTLSKVAT